MPEKTPDISISEASSIADDSSSSPDFDYIVIGGGAAGCPLAAKLAQKGRVLLLERGKESCPEPRYRTCCLDPAVTFHRTTSGTWAATANILGGGSAINAGVFLREPRDGKFFAGHSFLDWERIDKSYNEASEKLVSHHATKNSFVDSLVEAMKEIGLGTEAKQTDTYCPGIGHPSSLFSKAGVRHSSANLLPSPSDPSYNNMTVRTQILVTSLLFSTPVAKDERARIIGLEYNDLTCQDSVRTTHQYLFPTSKFYLCLGAIHTPALLQRSGIGSSSLLSSLGIPVIVDNPHVGKHLKDKPVIPIATLSKKPLEHTIVSTIFTSPSAPFSISSVSGGSLASQMVPLTLALLPHHRRSDHKRQILRKAMSILPTSVKNTVDNQFTLYVLAHSPVSEGSVTIKSAGGNEDVVITSGGASHPDEVAALFQGLTTVRDVISAPSLAPYRRELSAPKYTRGAARLYKSISGARYRHTLSDPKFPATFPVLPDLAFMSDEKKVPSISATEFVQSMTVEGWNYTSTCMVGKVVNEAFEVIGVDGLSIVDASVLKMPPKCNAQATVMMLGGYVGGLEVDS
jgi:choline dehydrogenase-like flavoprotein